MKETMSNKTYRLIKDIPTFKAGDEFFINEDGDLIAGTPEEPMYVTFTDISNDGEYYDDHKMMYIIYTKQELKENPEILTDWFEEIEEPKHLYTIDYLKNEIRENNPVFYCNSTIINLKSTVNYFKNEQEAKKHLEWLKARAIIIQDTKGFKPDWTDWNERKWCVEYNYMINWLCAIYTTRCSFGVIHFKSREDAELSIEAHEKEWKIYLGIEE